MERVTREVIPNQCQATKDPESGTEIPARYSGSVTFAVPDYDERMSLLIAIEEAGGSMSRDSSKADRYRYYQAIAKQLPKFVTKVDMTRIEDGFKFESLDQLQHDTDLGGGVITFLAMKLVESFAVGKKT